MLFVVTAASILDFCSRLPYSLSLSLSLTVESSPRRCTGGVGRGSLCLAHFDCDCEVYSKSAPYKTICMAQKLALKDNPIIFVLMQIFQSLYYIFVRHFFKTLFE